MMNVKVGIVDDHPVVRTGIRMFLEDNGCEVVLEAGSMEEALEGLKENEVSVLVLDVVMPGAKGISNFKELKNHFPEQTVLAYTSLANKTLISMLIQSGVEGYVSKSDQMDVLVKAIHQLADGQRYLPEEFRSLFSTKEQLIELSEREQEVLQAISEGMKTSQIAEKLFISTNTVESHRKNLFAKFDVTNMASLLVQAQKMGFIH
ncbi:MAG: response regulator transcription factor [Bacteroidetes bacterium]|nr:MAG: response regulator transcription factor [Bacteroidota bacterium]